MTTKFLVVQGDILISEDLSQILRDCIPASTIRRVEDVPEAVKTLKKDGPQDVVFLLGSAASSVDPELMDLLSERAVTAVRVGVENPSFTEVLYDGYRVAMPFSTGDIERLLGNIGLIPKDDA
ncbi:hypothetical protein JQX09_01905 [Sulfitobacter pseudonitzschiae]|uniref:Uncharacterized protein n=1 Tax=Pseudosulfitobacter pseudonitzschiae TaxID=1402135 RepID=A0A9Q2NXA2_9RHOB|nr:MULTISPECIES: hypothetical protein [Roseobacteraceae]MBM2290649.1 hypothetical protein [Pseudosulfitobacter pseudonitzschiae]MBM2295567.1 hypothetical protein [Pseudosulfitobacter pseudonitzschiae]MBM2300479.1 hypothetical protein [Pseudosulfitobacter pseudonitzschiae]MBM2310264.1 hypothetical protein [Pseudosulfitobacter pseudonitzschiae]MBM2315176.1 hypothetical protein [Pseudosulfitobacter pseudonitzschiae]|tara:strand:+ start:4531 stop:4899 length:369 start_codon:yes stop_codon:yes gene_type:complete